MSDSLDSFKVFKDFIKTMVLEDNKLQKLIYYPYTNCLDRDDLENPYDIFNEDTALNNGDEVHGVLLFKRRSSVIMNTELPLILVTFQTAPSGNSKEFDNVYIIFRIICKGTNVQELSNGDNRINSIYSLIDDNFNFARVNGLGYVKRQSYNELSINEENDAMMLVYKATKFSYNTSTNKNFRKKILGKNYVN